MSVIDARERFQEATDRNQAHRRKRFKEAIYDLRRSSEKFKKVIEEYKRKREALANDQDR